MDFGKDFFTSWGSMNVSGDNAMDFDFGPVAKGKKKAFQFDKMDVDFSLDGDLGKISAFKIDMSDLDISSPTKKPGTKEKSKEEAGDGNHKRKQDCSTFQFDFNELDNFKFEPSFTKEGNKICKKRDSEEPSKKEGQGSKPEQREIIGGSDSLDSNLSASKGMTTSNVITAAADLGKFDFTDHSLSLDSRADDLSKPPTIQKSLDPAQEETSPEIMSDGNPQEIVPEATFQEERASWKSFTQESTLHLPVKSVSEDQATQVTLPEEATKNVVKEKNGKRDSEASTELEKLLLETQGKSTTKLCSDDNDRSIDGDNDNISIGNKDGSEPAQDDVDSADTLSSNTSRKSKYVTESSNGKSEGGVPSPNSEKSKSIEMKEIETGNVRSKYFKRSAERESQIRQRQSSQTALSAFPAKLMSSKHQTGRRDIAVSKDAQEVNKVVRISDPVSGEVAKSQTKPECGGTVRGLRGIGESLTDGLVNGNKSAGFPKLGIGDKEKTKEDVSESNDAQHGSKDVRISDPISREMTKNIGEPEKARTLRALKDSRESLTDGLLTGNKLIGVSRLSDKVKTIEDVSESKDAQPGNKEIRIPESASGEMAKNNGEPEIARTMRALKDIGPGFKSSSPVKQNTKPTTQSHATTRTVLSTVSLKSSLNISGKENKAPTPKPTMTLPDLSALRISRALGARHSSNAAVQKQIYSSRDLTQISELQRSAASKLSPSISNEKHSQTSPSLKRKTYEGSSTDTLSIKPLKRFSPSPNASRSVKELVEGTNKEVLSNANIPKSPNTDCYQSPTLDIARVVNFTDFNMPPVVESDDYVEKAEAYTKDLEDMCNMLKKKNEEAKELLVRAVVNNNNLLMLNHPIYEEKIRMIQKFAAQLMSK